jgi:hypothetical protein
VSFPRQRFLAALVVAAAVIAGVAIARSQRPRTEQVEGDVRAEWTALAGRDKAAYAALLDDELIAVEVDAAGTRNKVQAIAEVDHVSIAEWTLTSLTVQPLGPKTAMATYEASLRWTPPAEVRFLRLYVTEVWVWRGDRWKLLHYQETRVR